MSSSHHWFHSLILLVLVALLSSYGFKRSDLVESRPSVSLWGQKHPPTHMQTTHTLIQRQYFCEGKTLTSTRFLNQSTGNATNKYKPNKLVQLHNLLQRINLPVNKVHYIWTLNRKDWRFVRKENKNNDFIQQCLLLAFTFMRVSGRMRVMVQNYRFWMNYPLKLMYGSHVRLVQMSANVIVKYEMEDSSFSTAWLHSE